MTFLHAGLAAAGLACVAIPIIIHLLARRRRRPVMWGAMRFLLEAYRKQRRRLQLEQLLLLAARCLLVALLAAAIARPLLEGAGAIGGAGASRAVYLIIDNALASGARDDADGRTALERHKRAASSVIDALGPGDRVGLITLGAPAQSVVAPPSPDAGAVRALVERIEPTESAADIAGALRAVADDIARADRATIADAALIVVISDFLTGSADLNQPLPRALESAAADGRLRFLATEPSRASPGNVQISAVEPLRPVILAGADALLDERARVAGSEQVRIVLRRTGAAVAERAVTTVRVGVAHPRTPDAPTAAARAVVRWTPGQSEATVSVAVDGALLTLDDGGAATIVAEIDQDALAGDNTHRRPVQVRDVLRVGVVDRRHLGAPARLDRMTPGEWVRLALRPSGVTPIETVDVLPGALDGATLAALDMLVVARPDLLDDDAWARIARFAHNGGLVLVTPPPEASVHLWSDAMSRRLGLGWRIAREPTVFEVPARLADEQPRSAPFALLHAELSELVRPVSVLRALPVEERSPASTALLTLADGSPWMLGAPPGAADESADDGERRAAGYVVYLASAPSLDWTDLPAKPLMVPLVQELARQGVGFAASAWAQSAGAAILAPQRAETLTGSTTAVDQLSLRVDAAGRTTEPVRRAGLFVARDATGAIRGVVAVNPDTRAGRTDAQSPTDVQAWLNQAVGGALNANTGVQWIDAVTPEATLRAGDQRSPVSLPLLIAALIVALIETVMARLFSHARAEPTTGEPAPTGAMGAAA